MGRGPRSSGSPTEATLGMDPRLASATTRREPGSDPDDHPLRRASPSIDDVESRRARSAVAASLFSGPPQPVRVGRYRVLGRIGSGGMGVVYRAHDPELARDVAVKVVNPDAGSGHEHARARLVREARAMARLAHPNVIHVYDVGTIEDGVFIAMELVEGESLAAWLVRETERDWLEVLRRFVEAGRGLAAAHAAGVIHRDFKPHNVLVGGDGRVRVGDFGLAGGDAAGPTGPHDAIEDDASEEPAALDRASLSGSLTRTGMLLGTPKYMSPEQEAGAPASARSDQFSFCVALYEALYGHTPYDGDTVGEYRRNVRMGRVRPPPLDSRVKGWVHAEIVRGLAVDPAERHPGMEVLLDRLDGALEDPRAAARRRRRLRLGGLGLVAASAVGLVLWGASGAEPPAADADASELVAAAPDGDEPDEAASVDPPSPSVRPIELPIPMPHVEPPPAEPPRDDEDDEDDDHDDAAAGSGSGSGSGSGGAARRPAAKRSGKLPRARRGSGSCFFEEDKKDFLGRTARRQSHLSAGGTCWDCRRALPAQIGSLNPSDCARYYLCGEDATKKKCES